MEALQVEVRKKLAHLNVTELTTIAGELSLTIPPVKLGKQSAIYNIVGMHLMSEDVEGDSDDGRAVYEHANSYLDRLLSARDVKVEGGLGGSGKQKVEVGDGKTADTSGSGDGSMVTTEVSTTVEGDRSGRLQGGAPGGGNNGSSSSNSNGGPLRGPTGVAPVPFQRIREFKIQGGTVGGEDSAVDLTSVVFQMEEGRQLGYKEREIRSGVIKAMKAGSCTRRYFERNIDNLGGTDFMAMLEELYEKKESSDLLDEMAKCVQGSKQKEKQYVVQMFELRDHILEVTQSEDEPLAEAFVQKKMIRAISVGLRRDTVRLEMRNVLKDPKISDRNLMKQLNEIVARDEENRRKMDNDKNGRTTSYQNRNAKVNSLSDNCRDADVRSKEESTSKVPDPQLSRIETQLGQLSVTMSELAEGKADVEARLKRLEGKLLDNERKPGGQGGNRNVHFPKCATCERERKYCTHCTKCGEADHKRKDCPKNS